MKNKLAKISSIIGVSALSVALSAQKAFAQITIPSNSGLNNLGINVGGGGFEVEPVVPNTGAVNNSNIEDTINLVDRIINAAFIILTGVIFVLFIWNMVQYLRTREEEYRKHMVRDFVILVLVVGIWGAVSWVANALGLGIGGTGVRPAI
jgi:hypothetical protein